MSPSKKAAASKKKSVLNAPAPALAPVEATRPAPAAKKSTTQEVMEKVAVALITQIITGGLAAAWPHIQQALGQLVKLSAFKRTDLPAQDREALLAGFLTLVGRIGTDVQALRDVASRRELPAEALGTVLGSLLTRRLAAAEPCNFDELLGAAERYGLMQHLERKLPARPGRAPRRPAGI